MKWDCEKCGLHYGSVRCFDKDCPHNTPKDTVYSISKCNTIGQGTYAIKIADGYKFDSVDENGNIIVKSIKPTYPKTYDECCEVLIGRKPNANEISFDRMELGLVDCDNTQSFYFQVPHLSQLNSLFRLLMCRDAYWKIAGEQMGLGKPWKPDWTTSGQERHTIGTNYDIWHLGKTQYGHRVLLVFPTAEMRDAFYENFKELLESCKELL